MKGELTWRCEVKGELTWRCSEGGIDVQVEFI